MKTLILSTVFLLCALRPAHAQQDSVFPKNTCRTWISLKEELKPVKGILFEVGDMSLLISNTTRRQDYFHGTYDVSKFDVRMIDAMTIKTKDYAWEGMWGGAVVGFIAGGATGCHYYFATSEHTENVWRDACLGGVAGAALGVLIGLLVPEKIKISINGSQVKIDLNKKMLREYSVK